MLQKTQSFRSVRGDVDVRRAAGRLIDTDLHLTKFEVVASGPSPVGMPSWVLSTLTNAGMIYDRPGASASSWWDCLAR